jgi:A/G-specific adenine glycosylase
MELHAAIRRALLTWYQREARDLPWRRTRDPYAVWVSEVMLQQTQIATVVPYYLRFLSAFPTVERLARAPLEQVLELWSGMGYYRRARNLHLAARQIVQHFDGRFPADYRAARLLPGVGEYTARAVLSIAYNQPYAALEGNGARVMARLFALKGRVAERAFRLPAQQHLEALLARRQPGNFNQAVMELGQTICLPSTPHCGVCPLSRWCAARRLGAPASFPQPRPRRATQRCHLAAAVILPPSIVKKSTGRQHTLKGDETVLLVKGLDEGLLNGLWNFPSAFGRSPAQAFARLRHRLAAFVSQPVDWLGAAGRARHPALKHGITHRAIQVRLYQGRAAADSSESARWFSLGDVEGAAVSQLARKIARQIQLGRLGVGSA